MLVLKYKPTDDDSVISDSGIESFVESHLKNVSTGIRTELIISQMLVIDGFRADLVKNKIDPSLVTIEIYGIDGEYKETVQITEDYSLTSRNAFPAVQLNFF